MSDYTKLKIRVKEMSELWAEGLKVVDIIAEKDNILAGIEKKTRDTEIKLETSNKSLETSKKTIERLGAEITEKEGKIKALNEYLAGGFKAQEAEMKRDLEEYIKKQRGEGEKTLEGLYGKIEGAKEQLLAVSKKVETREKRLAEIEDQLQAIKDGILV